MINRAPLPSAAPPSYVPPRSLSLSKVDNVLPREMDIPTKPLSNEDLTQKVNDMSKEMEQLKTEQSLHLVIIMSLFILNATLAI